MAYRRTKFVDLLAPATPHFPAHPHRGNAPDKHIVARPTKVCCFLSVCIGVLLTPIDLSHAQTVTTFTDRATYDAAIPAGSVNTLEDFASVTTNFLMSTTAPGDAFNGFSAARTGSTSFGTSGYCPLLSDPFASTPTACMGFNVNSPNVPGLVGAFSTSANVVFTPTNEIFSFAFDSIDWNDGFQRSTFVFELSNGTNIPITGPTNPSGPPPAFFGYILDAASRDAGIHIDRITWSGVDAPGELVGYWDIATSAPAPEIVVTGNSASTGLGQSPTITDAGDTVSFSVVLTNTALGATGTITLSSTLAGATIVCPSSGGNTINSLALNASETCTVTYTLTQSDFDTNGGGDGDIDDTVSASFDPGPGVMIISDADQVPFTTIGDLTIAKAADDTTGVTLGQVITYTYTVSNDGNLTITNINLDDVHNSDGPKVIPGGEILATGGGVPVSATTADAAQDGVWDALGPGDVVEFVGTHTVTQDDIDSRQ